MENISSNKRALIGLAFMGQLFLEQQKKHIEQKQRLFEQLIIDMGEHPEICEKVAKNAFFYKLSSKKHEQFRLEWFRKNVNMYVNNELLTSIPASDLETCLFVASAKATGNWKPEEYAQEDNFQP